MKILEQVARAIYETNVERDSKRFKEWNELRDDYSDAVKNEAKAAIQALIDAGATYEMKIAGSKAVISAGMGLDKAQATDLIEAGYIAMLKQILEEGNIT